MDDNKKIAIIIGAGPAGLTAAYELLQRTDIVPVLFEADEYLGGISRTIVHNGNRIDIGGHRFFSKSDTVMKWWEQMMPLSSEAAGEEIGYQNKTRTVTPTAPAASADDDNVMLVRKRISRIYYDGNLFEYPIRLSLDTIRKLGLVRMTKIFFSYVRAWFFPVRPEKSLEDFFINRFGRVLYRTFFKEYTEKVWGVDCAHIDASWGAQRIKGLSIRKALAHALGSVWKKTSQGISQKKVETSLIERFLYPKFGPGQMWEHVASLVQQKGGRIHMRHTVEQIRMEQGVVRSVVVRDHATNQTREVAGDYFFSTMPVKELIEGLSPSAPQHVIDIATALPYRDFMTVGLLLDTMTIPRSGAQGEGGLAPDTWIYIQEPGLQVGRIQIFNNWSPYLVAQKDKVWIGMEYFVQEGDHMWTMSDADFSNFAIQELEAMHFAKKADVRDAVVIRMKKTYPSYTGSYKQFETIRTFVDAIPNLFLVGRNGMHKYNNQDHSMLTAIAAVDAIIRNDVSKESIWAVNTEQDYHEEKKD